MANRLEVLLLAVVFCWNQLNSSFSYSYRFGLLEVFGLFLSLLFLLFRQAMYQITGCVVVITHTTVVVEVVLIAMLDEVDLPISTLLV